MAMSSCAPGFHVRRRKGGEEEGKAMDRHV